MQMNRLNKVGPITALSDRKERFSLSSIDSKLVTRFLDTLVPAQCRGAHLLHLRGDLLLRVGRQCPTTHERTWENILA